MPAGSNDKILRPVRPNVGIEQEYRKRLNKLIAEMQDSIVYWLSARYKATGLAQDDSPANSLQSVMDDLARQWQKRFNEGAGKLGAWFAQKTRNYSDSSLTNILKESGFAVEFKMTEPMRDAYQAVIHEQVGLIKSIAERHLQEVQGMVMRSVQQGRNLADLSKELEKRYGVTKRRAAFIAQSQNNMATATLTKVRQKELGIETAIWAHSHAGKHPRPEHVAADGKPYDIDKGMYLEGVWTWPGVQPRCRCVSRPVIRGFKH